MKFLRFATIIIPLVFGAAAAHWTALALWYDMKEGLIAFLGFLAAALVQVMPMTANFLQADKLTPDEAERLSASLTKQQRYWIGLLSATISAMVILIVGAALKGRANEVWSSAFCFFIASSLSFVLIKMFGLFEGVMSLQHLRSELVINSAKRDATEKAAAIQKAAEPTSQIVPESYGRLVRPH